MRLRDRVELVGSGVEEGCGSPVEQDAGAVQGRTCGGLGGLLGRRRANAGAEQCHYFTWRHRSGKKACSVQHALGLKARAGTRRALNGKASVDRFDRHGLGGGVSGHHVEKLQRVRAASSVRAHAREQVDQGAVDERIPVEPNDEESLLAGGQIPEREDLSRNPGGVTHGGAEAQGGGIKLQIELDAGDRGGLGREGYGESKAGRGGSGGGGEGELGAIGYGREAEEEWPRMNTDEHG